MELNTSPIKGERFDLVRAGFGHLPLDEFLYKFFDPSHADDFVSLTLEGKHSSMYVSGFEVKNTNDNVFSNGCNCEFNYKHECRDEVLTVLFHPAIDIFSIRQLDAALFFNKYLSEDSSDNGLTFKIKYISDSGMYDEPNYEHRVYVLYHGWNLDRVKSKWKFIRRDALRGNVDVSCTDNVKSNNEKELAKLQLISDFKNSVYLWIDKNRSKYQDKSLWLKDGYLESISLLGKLIRLSSVGGEVSRIQEEYKINGELDIRDSNAEGELIFLFQVMYSSMCHHLIKYWNVEANERFKIRQSARGKIGGKISKGGGRPPKKTEALLTQVREMKSGGLSYRDIAKQIKVSPTTIGKWLKSV